MIINPVIGSKVKYTGHLWLSIQGKVGTISRIAGEGRVCWVKFNFIDSGNYWEYPLANEVLESIDVNQEARQVYAMSLL